VFGLGAIWNREKIWFQIARSGQLMEGCHGTVHRGGGDKDQPLAGDNDATAAQDGSAATAVKVLGDVAESY
jgi:hypothetical protein